MQFISLLILGLSPLIKSQPGCPNHDFPDDCGRCSSHDDPHIVTLDGLRYDQHTDGCFKYVTSCNSATDYLPFELCGCHEECGFGGGSDHSECPNNIRCIRDLHLTFFDSSSSAEYEISIDADNALNEAIDSGTTYSLGSLVSGTTYSFAVSNYFVYTKTGTVHEFEVFSGSSSFYAHIRYLPGNLEVFLSETYFTDLACGLCGLYNGDQDDDFTDADGNIVLLPSDIPYGPISAATNSLINNFANTYLCNGSSIPADIPCEPDQDDQDCFAKAVLCCEDLWDAMGIIWDNEFVDEDAFKANWLENCALDACAIAAITMNQLDCDNPGDAFSYAKAIADETSSAVYTVQEEEDEYESNCTAKICAHGDNEITLDVSYDGGSSWYLAVESETNWKKTLTYTTSQPVNADTVLRFTVEDIHSYGVGGFIASVRLCGSNGYIFDFYTDTVNTYFDVTSDSAGDPLLDVFNAFGSGPWSQHVNEEKVECMNTNADWMWNDKTENTMVFELFFGHHTDILQRLECVQDETPAPTVDCCEAFSSVDDYLDTCYCASETPSPISISVDSLQAVNANGASVGVNVIHDDNSKNVFYKKMNEEMNEIKNMIYGTWLMIFACFVINMSVVNGCGCSKKKMHFKSVEDDECL